MLISSVLPNTSGLPIFTFTLDVLEETLESCDFVGDVAVIGEASGSYDLDFTEANCDQDLPEENYDQDFTEENCEIWDGEDEKHLAMHLDSVPEAPAELRRRAKAGDDSVRLTY